MNEVSLNQNKLVAKWTVDDLNLENFFTPQSVEKPKFENPVDDIIWTLEHENDPKQLNLKELQDEISQQIVKDIDQEIMNTLINTTGGKCK